VRSKGPVESATLDLVYSVFSALVATAECRKGLFFETAASSSAPPVDPKAKDPKAAAPGGPGSIDTALLPARVALDIANNLKRQGSDSQADLAYSSTACQDAQKALPFRSVSKHAFSLRRECDIFGSIYHQERRLCDQLHVALAQASPEYARAKVLDEALITAISSPVETPSGGDVLMFWTRPDLGSQESLPNEHIAFVVFVCPLSEAEGGGAKPMVARCNDVNVLALRQLTDSLSADMLHCRPAAAVAAAYIEQRLRCLVQVLRGSGSEAGSTSPGIDQALDAALPPLLVSLAAENGESGDTHPELLDSGKVCELLVAVLRLLDHRASAGKISFPALGNLLRVVLQPLRCLAGSSAPNDGSVF